MTKKDYEAIAKVLKHHIVGTTYFEAEVQKTAQSVMIGVARDMASTFSADNSRFDTGRFLRACGVQA